MDAFGTVIIVVAIVAGIVAILSFIGAGGLYKDIGKGGLSLDEPSRSPGPPPGSAAARAESDAELRQLLEAKSFRREARGEEPLDVDAELAALSSPAAAHRDAALEQEVRELVIARNERRLRKGEDPLDVEEEVERQLRELGA